MCDGDPSMEYPYIETDEQIHALYNWEIRNENGNIIFACKNGYFDGVEPVMEDVRIESPEAALEYINNQ